MDLGPLLILGRVVRAVGLVPAATVGVELHVSGGQSGVDEAVLSRATRAAPAGREFLPTIRADEARPGSAGPAPAVPTRRGRSCGSRSATPTSGPSGRGGYPAPSDA